MSFPTRLRVFSRALHTTRTTRGASPPWGSQVNEPGGRLFGEPILKPGQRRKPYDWEVQYVSTMCIATVMMVVGLNSRPDTSAESWARHQAELRMAEASPPASE